MEEGEGVKEEVKGNTKPDFFSDKKLKIPGLDPKAVQKSSDDKNLAPFSLTTSKLLQYGDTRFISTDTDRQDWAPGECLNLHKYEGNFRVKLSCSTQQVNCIAQLDKLKSCNVLGSQQNQIHGDKKGTS